MGLICPLYEFCLSGFAIVDQNEIDGNYLIITYTFHDQKNVIKSHALIDCCATSYTFIDKDYSYHHHLPLHLLKSPRNLTIIDGRSITSGAIIQIVQTCFTIHTYQEDILLFVTKLWHYRIVLIIL
jgi:hypothetical protein